mgnify:CR=1 FL=1
MKHVYIFDMDNDRVKIGVSDNVDRRISEVQNSSGFAVRRHHETGLLSDTDAYYLERDLHIHFAAYRARGEFFKIAFEAACAELDKRITTAITPQEEIHNLIRLFVKTFCTTDKNERGDFDNGINHDSFLDEFYTWFNCNSKTSWCFPLHRAARESHYEGRERLEPEYACLTFYPRGTTDEIRSADSVEIVEEGLGGSRYYGFRGFGILRFDEVFWKRGTPPELALRKRVQRIRNTFLGLDQQTQDSIIGEFIDSFAFMAQPEIFTAKGVVLDKFIHRARDYVVRQLKELCGEPFFMDYSSEDDYHFVAHTAADDLDYEKVGVYCGSFMKIIQRCCHLEIFDNGHGLRVRHIGRHDRGL